MNLANKPLAMAYVPWQHFENVMDAGCGLAQGSIFEDLVLPFVGAQAACQADCCPNRPQPRQKMNYSHGRRCDC